MLTRIGTTRSRRPHATYWSSNDFVRGQATCNDQVNLTRTKPRQNRKRIGMQPCQKMVKEAGKIGEVS